MEKMEKLKKPLKKEDIECRIGSIYASGFSLLLYKTARVDAQRLDDVFGANWQRKHYVDAKSGVVCGISIYNEELKEWVTREDVGSESFSDKEKGAYSDAFKRAGSAWGIGREIYQAPFIFIPQKTKHLDGNKYQLEKDEKKYAEELYVSNYEYCDGKLNITITDKKGNNVFSSANKNENDSAFIDNETPKKTPFKTDKKSIEVLTTNEEVIETLTKANFSKKPSYKNKDLEVFQKWVEPDKIETVKKYLNDKGINLNAESNVYK